ncbi:MAG: hypothetical protein AAGD96_36680, partial [Chloroflexota bacterium]
MNKSPKEENNTSPAEKAEKFLDNFINESSSDRTNGDTPNMESPKGELLLTQLLAASRRMAELRTLDPLLAYVIDNVLSLVGAEQGYIVLISSDGEIEYRVR